MKTTTQTATLVPQPPGKDGMYKQIERAGRVCYKSEDKITDGSAEAFVNRLMERKHLSVLEHGAVYLAIPNNESNYVDFIRSLDHDPYTFGYGLPSTYYVSTNYRVIIEKGMGDVLQYATEPTGRHHERLTFHIVAERSIIDELCRHRCASFSVESTRYCDYSNNKHGGELTFVLPAEWNDMDIEARDAYIDALCLAENHYKEARRLGLSPQYARGLLPLSVKCECYMTAFEDDWLPIIRQRKAEGAHPTMRALATEIEQQINNGRKR